MDKEYYLFVDGKKVVVSKEVYLAYHSELNKEKYQMRRGCCKSPNIEKRRGN